MTLTLRPRTLEIHVLSPDGEPVPRFQARLALPKGYEHLGVRGEGRVRLRLGVVMEEDGVLDVRGAYVEVWGARDADDRGLPYAPRRVGPLSGDERDVEVRMQPGAVISGRVLGPDGPVGEPLKVSITLPKARGEGMAVVEDAIEEALPGLLGEDKDKPQQPRLPFEGIATEVKTDAEGAFRAAGLGTEADHLVQVEAPERFLPAQPVQAKPGDAPLEIRLRPTVSARITVLGPDGKPRVGANVQARPECAGLTPQALDSRFTAWSSTQQAATDAAGVATLERLDPEATYALTVTPDAEDRAWVRRLPEETRKRMGLPAPAEPDASRPLAAKHRQKDWRPADTTVHLKAAFRLSGRVVDTQNQPVKNARVQRIQEDDYDSATTDDQGRFEFTGLVAGRLRLVARNTTVGGGGGFDLGYLVASVTEAAMGGAPPAKPGPEQVELDLTGDLSGVTLKVPATLSVTLKLAAAPAASGPPKPTDLFRSMFRGLQVTLLRKTEKGWVPAGSRGLDPTALLSGKEQKVEVKGLEAGGRYGAWMPPSDGRYVWAEFAAEAGTVDLERREGGVVTGRVFDLPPGSAFARVSLRDDVGRTVESIKTDREGRFEVKGLPASRWTVRASHRAPGEAAGRRGHRPHRRQRGPAPHARRATTPTSADAGSVEEDVDEALPGR